MTFKENYFKPVSLLFHIRRKQRAEAMSPSSYHWSDPFQKKTEPTVQDRIVLLFPPYQYVQLNV